MELVVPTTVAIYNEIIELPQDQRSTGHCVSSFSCCQSGQFSSVQTVLKPVRVQPFATSRQPSIRSASPTLPRKPRIGSGSTRQGVVTSSEADAPRFRYQGKRKIRRSDSSSYPAMAGCAWLSGNRLPQHGAACRTTDRNRLSRASQR